jgi:hypothetical protein
MVNLKFDYMEVGRKCVGSAGVDVYRFSFHIDFVLKLHFYPTNL